MNWRPITDADVGKTMLVTNNIKARDAFGEMSHRWITWIQAADDPENTGKYVGYDCGDRLLHNLTHCAPIPVPEQEGASEALGEPKASEPTSPNAREAALATTMTSAQYDAALALARSIFAKGPIVTEDGTRFFTAEFQLARALLSPQGGERELEEAADEMAAQLAELVECAERDLKMNRDEEPGGHWSLRTANCFLPARDALARYRSLSTSSGE